MIHLHSATQCPLYFVHLATCLPRIDLARPGSTGHSAFKGAVKQRQLNPNVYQYADRVSNIERVQVILATAYQEVTSREIQVRDESNTPHLERIVMEVAGLVT